VGLIKLESFEGFILVTSCLFFLVFKQGSINQVTYLLLLLHDIL